MLVRLIGWRALLLHGDPCVFDRWRWLRRHLKRGPLRTLDAGCGTGALTIYAAAVGNESVGLSSDPRSNRMAHVLASSLGIRGVKFVDGDLRDLERLSRKVGSFDQVICFETIEHILNDRKLLRDLASLLRPGGRLLLTTPFKHYKPIWGDSNLSKCEDGGHVRRGYTFEEVRELFGGAGLDVLAEEYVSGFISQKLTSMLRFSSQKNERLAWRLMLPLRILQVLDAPLTKLIGYPYLSIGVVGIKREKH